MPIVYECCVLSGGAPDLGLSLVQRNYRLW